MRQRGWLGWHRFLYAESTKDVAIYPTHCFNTGHEKPSCLDIIVGRRAVMELWQLRTFRVVAETLNFTRAGKQLNLTQSAVSHQIKALETELGEPLFIRAKRGV